MALADLIDFVSQLTPGPLLVLGLLLILIDIFVTSDTYLGFIGLAVMGVGGINALGASEVVQLVSLPVFLVLLLTAGRDALIDTSRKKDLALRVSDLMGARGTVLDTTEEDAAEGRADIHGFGEWRVRERRGRPLRPHEKIRVLARESMLLFVEADASKPGLRVAGVSGADQAEEGGNR